MPAPNGFRKVLIQGAFDILHIGHLRVFEFAKAQGEFLIVALNSNDLIANYKRREPMMLWEDKKALIEALRPVDMVIKATDFSPLALLQANDVDVYVVADEWVHTKAAEIAYMESKGGTVAIAPRFTTFSTTEIRARLLAQAREGVAA
jgi:cytidyltransferase-like protein